jgi:hypothetical protein
MAKTAMPHARELDRLETVIDGHLAGAGDGFYRRQRPQDMVRACDEYARLAWQTAAALGPRANGAADLSWAPRLVASPVFVMGAPRSGTTLLRNLLDGHPALSVLPCEGNLLTQFQARLRRMTRSERVAFLGRAWIARLVHSDGVPPYWLLGRAAARENPYVGFAQRAIAWAGVPCVTRLGAPYDAFVAVVLAFAASTRTDRQMRATRHWVEKSPLHELDISTSVRFFPEARCVHVVRDPRAVLLSRRTLEANAGGRPEAAGRFAREIGRSLKLAIRNQRLVGASQYCILRYEDFVTEPRAATARLCAFLRIAHDAAVDEPTVTGRPVPANSSHEPPTPTAASSPTVAAPADLSSRLTAQELRLLRRHAGPAAAALGYRIGP